MKAILTKYLGPTNTRGSRIKAYDGDGNAVIISMPHEKNHDDAHKAAAEALCKNMKWPGKLIGGGIKGGMAFVFVN